MFLKLEFKGVILDLDGVVYRGSQAIPGAAETIDLLRKKGVKIVFLTNASMSTRERFAEKLSGFGIPVNAEEIITSAYGTAAFMKEKFGKGKVFVVGEEGLREDLSIAGFKVREDENVDFVVVGLDRKFDFAKLTSAFHAIRKGARFIASNYNEVQPLENGFNPGSAAMVGAISACTEKQPETIIGKPNTFLLELAARKMNLKPKEILAVGDTLGIDVLAGNRFNCFTLLVLTGVSTREEAENASPECKPKLILDSLADLQGLL